MAINAVCSSCLRRLKFKNTESGLSRKCPGCGGELTVPGEPLPVNETPVPSESKRNEFIIAGIILVVAVVGAIYGVKWWQSSQVRRDTSGTSRSSDRLTSSSGTTVRKTTETETPGKSISEILDDGEAVELGPAKVSVIRADLVAETAIKRSRAERGKMFAVVGLRLTTVEAGPAFDTLKLKLLSADRKGYGVLVTSGSDREGRAYEASRKRVTSVEVADGPVTVDVYFEIPAGLDPKTCQLRYK